MGFDFERPIDETPLQSVPLNPDPYVAEELIEVEDDVDVSDGFLDDGEATESDGRLEGTIRNHNQCRALYEC